jgi:hypothetical protein
MEADVARQQQDRPPECFTFVWRRRVKGAGFSWVDDPKFHWLLVGPPENHLSPYEPLAEETGLFLTFANLATGREAFLHFADRYGRLGTYHQLGPLGGEPLDEWRRHHRWMHFLARLRGGCEEGRGDLAAHVRWQGEEVVYRFPAIGTGAEETWRHRGQLRVRPSGARGQALFRPGDLVGPARWFLVYALDDWLQELQHWKRPVACRMRWSEKEGQPQMAFGPSNLLGAMVCQFAAALHGAWPFRECAQCHRFFRLLPGDNRANRLTCSHTCKQYLYNRRVQHAGELFARGLTPVQIAKELKVSPQSGKSAVDVVKGWIDRARRGDR